MGLDPVDLAGCGGAMSTCGGRSACWTGGAQTEPGTSSPLGLGTSGGSPSPHSCSTSLDDLPWMTTHVQALCAAWQAGDDAPGGPSRCDPKRPV